MAEYSNNSNYYLHYLSFPIHLWFFLAVVFLVFGFTWYVNYESVLEDAMSHLKLLLMLSPVFLLLAVHCLSGQEERQWVPLPEQDSVYSAGGSPWGVAAVLVFLMLMISYQSKLRENWFPYSR